MPVYLYILVGAAALVAVVLARLDSHRRKSPGGTYPAEMLAFVGAGFNALFILLLALYTVISWNALHETEQHSAAEAAGLTELYWQVSAAPEPERGHLREMIREYTRTVADQEWPELGRGRADQKASHLLVGLRVELSRIPVPAGDESAQAQVERTARSITDERRARIEQATDDNGLLTLLLVGAVIGAATIVGYPLLMGFSTDARHIVGLVLLAAVLGFVLYVSVELAQPFSGLVRVEPDAFRAALTEFSHIP